MTGPVPRVLLAHPVFLKLYIWLWILKLTLIGGGLIFASLENARDKLKRKGRDH